MAASSELLWLLTKKQNRFLIKQNGRSGASVSFSRDPLNLTNVNSFQQSGLVNDKAVGIEAGSEGLQIVLSKKTKKQNQPLKAVNKILLKKGFQKKVQAIVNQVEEYHYRPDLTRDALARLSAVNKSLKFIKSGGRSKGKARKSKAIQS